MQHESSQNHSVKERIQQHGSIVNCYGENLSFHCEDAVEVLQQLIIDDGVLERGHRENIFHKDFKLFGCCSGPHKDYDTMTCMQFAGGLVKKGEPDPIQQQLDAFLREQVDLEMPTDVRSYKQNSKVHVHGSLATKTVTRTCILKDGSEKVLTKTIPREFTY